MSHPRVLSSPASATYSAHDLMREMLRLTSQRFTEPERFIALATEAGFRQSEQRIFFLTQLKERVRLMPLKLFVSPETREQLLEALQSALDQEIDREDAS